MIRRALAQDAEQLGVLASHVFLDTYGPQGVNRALAGEVLGRFGPERMAQRLSIPKARALVAEAQGWMVGFADLNLRAEGPGVAGGEVLRLYVHPRHQGRGLGAGLLQAAEQLLREEGEHTCWLTAWEGNARALGFYPRQGYAEVGESEYVIDGAAYRNIVFSKML